MKRFDITWVEYHSATVMAENEEEAQEIATSIDANETYSDSDDMTVTIIPDGLAGWFEKDPLLSNYDKQAEAEKCYPLTEISKELGETFPEAYTAWKKENS